MTMVNALQHPFFFQLSKTIPLNHFINPLLKYNLFVINESIMLLTFNVMTTLNQI